jgi:DNA helicase-2/ATP-dependent DNA helicase PcrA
MSEYLKELNDKQKEAVEHTNGPLIIIAGAGSGKTKVLTTRIAHLMKQGVDPFRILALTFTNKAAAEMKERIDKILGSNESRNLYIGTFHSVFAKILRIEAEKIGYPSSFTIYDSDDSKSVIKSILQQFNLDDKLYKPNLVHNRISAAKNNLISPYEYLNTKEIQMEDSRSNRPHLGQLYAAYVEKCFKNGAMDFDDLLVKMYELLIKNPDVLSKYQHRFQYVMIDEYQDTNMAQYKIVKLLAAMHENICVVGDDAQSIYSFRGATIENILRFQDDYPDAKMVKLEQNYRCTQNIINVANAIINNNKKQIPKDLWTGNDIGEKIKLVRTLTDNDEGRYVADAILEQKLRYHYDNKDFAILYRTNAQSRSFEESLRKLNIPYKIFGGLSFYQRKEIKDYIAYLRFVVNPNDEEAFKRIINYPARGIGKTSLDRILSYANENNVSIWNIIQNPAAIGIKGAAASAIEQFTLMIRYFHSLLHTKNAYEVAFEVGKRSQLVAELYADKTVEGQGRYENVQELLNSIKEYTETPNEDGELENDKSLGTYLQQITLLTDGDNDKEEDQNVVKLMTIHAAKGLEFPCVFAVGLEENIFPSAMSVYDREGLEEERRLFYVVVTRAKHKLWVSFAHNRYRFGNLVSNEPSRFIEEIPESFIDKTFAGVAGARGSLQTSPAKQGFNRTAGINTSSKSGFARQAGVNNANTQPTNFSRSTTPTTTYVHQVSKTFNAATVQELKVGQKVEHQRFGFGIIKKIDGTQSNTMATIQFEQAGEKKIMLQYAKLSIVNP